MTTDPERLAARCACTGNGYMCKACRDEFDVINAKHSTRCKLLPLAEYELLLAQLAEARQDGERLAAERDAWRDYSEAKEGLLVAYRTGRGPSGKLWAKIERTRETIDRLAAARASLSNDNG